MISAMIGRPRLYWLLWLWLLSGSASGTLVPLVDGALADPPEAGEVLGVRVLGSAAGLPQLTVFALTQAADGLIYAGTQDGLSRWDGRRFEAVPLVGAKRDWVSHLQANADGLWIGTEENGLQLLDAERLQEVLSDTGARLSSIEAITGAARGGVWVGTADGLWHCDASQCRMVPDTATLQVAELLESGDTLWLGTNLDGLYRFQLDAQGQPRNTGWHLGQAEGLPNDAVRALVLDRQQRLWIGTGRGLARWDGKQLTRWTQIDRNTPLGPVFGLQLMADDSLLAAMWTSGLARFRPDGGFRVSGLAAGLPDTYLNTVLASGDPDQPIVWLGSGSSGVLRLEPGPWQSFDERQGLPQRVVVGVGSLRRADGSETIWSGTLGGAVQLQQGRWVPLLPPPYRDWVVYDLLEDPLGRQWFGTQRGLLLHEHDHWREFDAEHDALPDTSVEQLLWHDGELWLGTGHGMAALRGDAGQGYRFERLLQDQPAWSSLAVRSWLALELPGRGRRVLLGSGSGPLLTDGRKVETLPPECAGQRTIYDIEQVASDEAWLGTRDGVVRLRWTADGAFVCSLVHEPGNGAPTVFEIALDRVGRVYLFGYDGVRRVENPRSAQIEVIRFGLADGLPALEFNRDALLDASGRLWAANAEGLVRFDPDAIAHAPLQAILKLMATLDGRPLATGARLSATHGELGFVPRLLSFRHEHRIRYRIRLHGLDPADSEWLADGDRRYSRIPPGQYRFVVDARDAAGRLHGPAEFEFSVAAPWWLHPLSLLAGMAGLLLAGVLVGRVRARRLSMRARQLEQLVAERTRELEHVSNTDPLTAAWNRRYFHASIADWLQRSAADGGLFLLLIDLDHFKQINDQHGHSLGDLVLVEAANRLRNIGPAVRLIRWGGEEFLLVLPCEPVSTISGSALAEQLKRRAGQVLRALSSAPIQLLDGQLALRASLGCTHCWPLADSFTAPIDELIARADAALYRAKQSGRDRAVVANPVSNGTLEFEVLVTGTESRA